MTKTISPQFLARIRRDSYQKKLAFFNRTYEQSKSDLRQAAENPNLSPTALLKAKARALKNVMAAIENIGFNGLQIKGKTELFDFIYVSLKLLEITRRSNLEHLEPAIQYFIDILEEVSFGTQDLLNQSDIDEVCVLAKTMHLLDPITHDIPYIPVFNKLDRYTERYDLPNFLKWFLVNHTDPLTRSPINSLEQLQIDEARFDQIMNLWGKAYKQKIDKHAQYLGIFCLVLMVVAITNSLRYTLQSQLAEDMPMPCVPRPNLTM